MCAGLRGVRPTTAETAAPLPGDDLVIDAQVVMDRAFDLPVDPATAWPWFVQLGRNRAGWYLPHRVEHFVPARRRALRRLDPTLQHLAAGDVIDDWGGRNATLEVVEHRAPGQGVPGVAVHRSTRGRIRISWTFRLSAAPGGTRVHLRFRLAGARRPWLAEYGGGLFDLLTVAGLAAGLRERVTQTELPPIRRPGGSAARSSTLRRVRRRYVRRTR